MTPYISIIIPCYNTAQFLEETLRSVQNQTYKDWEAIVINDCSTDVSKSIITSFLSDPRFIYLENEINSGVAVSRNRGIKIARGEMISFLDSDDYWAPDKIEKQLELAHKNPNINLFSSNYYRIDENGRILNCANVPQSTNYEKEIRKSTMLTSAFLFRANV